jgi:hypothetical protein
VLVIALEASTMSLEHSLERQKKGAAAAFASPGLEPLYTRAEVAARYRTTATWVTRNYRRLGLRPIAVGKLKLFPEGQLVELDRRALAGELTAET